MVVVAQKVCVGVYKGVTTSQLDELAAETAAAMTASHPDYALVSTCSAISEGESSSLTLSEIQQAGAELLTFKSIRSASCSDEHLNFAFGRNIPVETVSLVFASD